MSSGDLATAFDAINRATDWASFTAAVDAFSAPSMNIVYADVDGNIGYAMSGRLPVRSSGDGRMPVDGSAGAGVDRLDRAVDAAARAQSGRGIHLLGQQRDRSRLQRLDHA